MQHEAAKVNYSQSIAIAYSINDIARVYRTCLDRSMAEHGLTRSQWWLLANLKYNDGVSQQRLAEMLEMGRSAVGKLIDQLEDNGWIERRRNTDDKRAYCVYLTSKITRISDEIDSQANTLVQKSLLGLSKPDRKRLLDFLDQIKTNLFAMS